MKKIQHKVGSFHFHGLRTLTFLAALCCLLFVACRGEDILYGPDTEELPGTSDAAATTCLYVLNEGNMGSNKCTLDRLDFKTGEYLRDIYPQANPSTVLALGDVGNDIQQYGSRLWAVINCSNKVEVMDASSARRIGQVNIPNCRYVTFHEGYAYVSSYAGPVEASSSVRSEESGGPFRCEQRELRSCSVRSVEASSRRQRGYVAKVDTATLAVIDTCVVGYQPEEMAIVDGRLYVANSGGYQAPDYDRTISVISLSDFAVHGEIDVAPNLHHLRADHHGNLWVTSRGNYADIPSSLYVFKPEGSGAANLGKLDIPVGEMTLSGDSLFIISSEWNNIQQKSVASYGVVNVLTHEVVSRQFITDGTDSAIKVPYGLAVHPQTKEVYVTDARDYVNPGTLYCFSPAGQKLWSVRTGDIPGHLLFSGATLTQQSSATTDTLEVSPYISRVFDYRPAPGQHINVLPKYEPGDDSEAMRQKAEEALKDNRQGMVSLGAWGGSITFGFDHLVENHSGRCDLRVLGNAYYSDLYVDGGNAEPGIVEVSYDANGNGLPDDEWYELKGSAHDDPATLREYEVTYYRAGSSGESGGSGDIYYEDNRGNDGWLAQLVYHTQSYFPEWLAAETLTFSGTRLPDNGEDMSGNGTYWLLRYFDYGYADNHPNSSEASALDLDWAVDRDGNPVHLDGIHFVRVTTAVFQQCGWLGETSTEILGAVDL